MVGNRVLQVVFRTPKPNSGFALTKPIFDSIRLPGQGPLKAAGPDFQPFSFKGVPGSVLLPAKPKVETLPMLGNPDHSVIVRATAEYGNRTYVAAYIDLPAEAADDMAEPDAVIEGLDEVSQDVIRNMGGKNLSRKSSTRDGNPLVTTEFSYDSGWGFGRIYATFKDLRAYIYLAGVPPCLKNSEEVAKFFGSIRLKPRS